MRLLGGYNDATGAVKLVAESGFKPPTKRV
jgi:hypothetical protein